MVAGQGRAVNASSRAEIGRILHWKSEISSFESLMQVRPISRTPRPPPKILPIQALRASYRLSFHQAVAIILRFYFRMPDSEQGLFLARSLKYLQESLRRSGPAAAASYALLGAIVLLGGIGYLLDGWRGTSPWFFLTGLILGLIVGFVQLARVVFKK